MSRVLQKSSENIKNNFKKRQKTYDDPEQLITVIVVHHRVKVPKLEVRLIIILVTVKQADWKASRTLKMRLSKPENFQNPVF